MQGMHLNMIHLKNHVILALVCCDKDLKEQITAWRRRKKKTREEIENVKGLGNTFID